MVFGIKWVRRKDFTTRKSAFGVMYSSINFKVLETLCELMLKNMYGFCTLKSKMENMKHLVYYSSSSFCNAEFML